MITWHPPNHPTKLVLPREPSAEELESYNQMRTEMLEKVSSSALGSTYRIQYLVKRSDALYNTRLPVSMLGVGDTEPLVLYAVDNKGNVHNVKEEGGKLEEEKPPKPEVKHIHTPDYVPYYRRHWLFG